MLWLTLAMPEIVDGEVESIQSAPDDEGPSCAICHKPTSHMVRKRLILRFVDLLRLAPLNTALE